MLIVCPNCTTSYEIGAEALGTGRSVRCARCKNTWFATPDELIEVGAEPELVVAGTAIEDAEARAAAATKELEDEWKAALAAEPVAHGKFETEPEIVPPPPAIHADDVPPLSPAAERMPEPIAAEEPHADIETIAARRAQIATDRKRRRQAPLLNLPVVILFMGVLIALLIGARETVVRLAPQTAGLYARIGLPVNLRGLVFDDVRTSDEMQDGVPVMVVEGTIVNVSNRVLDLPRLRFAVRNAAGLEIYAWTAQPPQPQLRPGARSPFRSRLASPPTDMRDLVVRFFTRRDLEGGR